MNQYDYEDQLLEIEDFGCKFCKEKVDFKVWAPDCDRLEVAIYENGEDIRRQVHAMKRDSYGVWTIELDGDYENKFYNYIVFYEDKRYEIVDPYAKTTSINSLRAMIVDSEKLNPKWWIDHEKPKSIKDEEVIIYETHVRDFTAHETSGIKEKGKYLGMAEKGTSFEGISTGIDHLKELGITHIHLLPIADFATVDERTEEYNWGYDPFLYNVPEGSYVTHPIDGYKRVLELKKMIKTYHENGIRVILDVVYNHTYYSKTSNFNRLVPNYYYRQDENGNFSNGSGVGNEIATERKMVRKYIIDSLVYWLEEYKVDGFRFDLLALYDKVTVMKICQVLKAKKSDIVLYGEPWTGSESALPYEKRFLRGDQKGVGIGIFNDHFRNAVRGDNDENHNGFVCGNYKQVYGVLEGVVGGIFYSGKIHGFTKKSTESINYISCHDDLILADRLSVNRHCDEKESLIRINLLALGLLLTSFGTPFLHAGTEFMRSKKYVRNSYNRGNEINGINWKDKKSHEAFFESVKWLIQFRQESRLFLKSDDKDIKRLFDFQIIDDRKGIISYTISNDIGDCFRFIHNCESEYFELKSTTEYEVLFEGKPLKSPTYIEKNTSYKAQPLMLTILKEVAKDS
jgi:pullulanase